MEQAEIFSGNEAYGFSNERRIHLKSSAMFSRRCRAFIALWLISLMEFFSIVA